MRVHQENGQWINHRVMPIYPDEMATIYNHQLQQVKEGQLAQQFGHEFEIHKDGVYQFLALKNDWEQRIITNEKEEYEKKNPAKIILSTEKFTIIADKTPEFSYTNPFVPIYCKGDDLSYAITKPTIIYEEVPGTKIEIENMPAYKTQDDLGDCRAFSLAAILQQYVNTKWKSDIPDPKNPPFDSAISYFGLLAYTNQVPDIDYTFEPNQDNARSMRDIIDSLSKNGNRLILENCKHFENLVKSFSSTGQTGLNKRDEFFNYSRTIFERFRNKDEKNVQNLSEEIGKLNDYVKLEFNQPTLKKALTKNSFNEFLYTLIFSECKKENFPSGFRAAAFPLDSMDVTTSEIKNQILKGLHLNKPVLLPALCVSEDKNDECKMPHSIVISGYKKVKREITTIEVFKIHNSWGSDWQQKNNDGWMDADAICKNISKIKSKDGSYYRIASSSVMWLD